VISDLERTVDDFYDERNWLYHPLLVGATGMGKSATLAHLARHVASLGWPVLRIALTNEIGELSVLTSTLERGVEKLGHESSVAARAAAAIRRLPVRPKSPWFDIVETQRGPAVEQFELAFRELERFADRLGVPALLVLDEMHTIGDQAANALINAISDRDESPVLIAAAGLSSAWDALVFDTMSPASRLFSPVDLLPLSVGEAASLLCDTARTEGADWPEALVRNFVHVAHGVPASLQELGYALWDDTGILTEKNCVAIAATFAEHRDARTRRFLSRLPVGAVALVRQLALARQEGTPVSLFTLRSVGLDDHEFRRSVDALERAGLVVIDNKQQVSVLGNQESLEDMFAIRDSGSRPELLRPPDH